MANYFVDSANGDDLDDGTTMDDGPGDGSPGAWATIEHAIGTGGLVAGDIVWIRRTHSEAALNVVNATYDGTSNALIKFIGWPRASDTSISSATWANGSRTVDLIVGLSMDTEQHITRYITGPDGADYMISLVTDANTIQLSREYTGANASGAGGAATIKADEDWVDDMGTEYGFDDSGWTIKETTWDADADDLPTWDFSGGAWYLYFYIDAFHYLANIYFIGGTAATGTVYFRSVSGGVLRGCYITQAGNAGMVVNLNSSVFLHRVVGLSQNAGGSSYGLYSTGGRTEFADVVIDGCRYGAYLAANAVWSGRGLSLGLNTVNSYNIYVLECGIRASIADYYEGSPATGQFTLAREGRWFMQMENYQNILGAHKEYNQQGTITKLDVVAGSGDPYKRTGGADSVVEVLYNRTSAAYFDRPEYIELVGAVFTHEFEATTDERRYRYYVQAEGAVLATELWIEVEYVSAYDDTSEYVIKKVTSEEAITVRGDATDWSQYIEVEGIEPAVGSTVRIKCYCSYYDATNKIYIDPLVVIS